MKLKLFEEFGERLFHGISRDEWADQFDSKDVSELDYFSDSELKFFLEYFKDWVISDTHGIPLTYHKKMNMIKVIKVTRDSLDDDGFSIGKLPDEWYYIYDRYTYEFYKCDSFDGVIECILYCTKDIAYQFTHSMNHYKNK